MTHIIQTNCEYLIISTHFFIYKMVMIVIHGIVIDILSKNLVGLD